MAGLETCRTKNGDTGTEKMQRPETFDKPAKYLPGKAQFIDPWLGAIEVSIIGACRYNPFRSCCHITGLIFCTNNASYV
jgi:hypothetical protein